MFLKKTLIRSKVYSYVLEVNTAVMHLATDDDIKVAILRKMLRHEYIGARHTSIDNIPKGFPKSDRKRVMKVARELIREGYFSAKRKPDSLHVSLNPVAIRHIKEEIES